MSPSLLFRTSLCAFLGAVSICASAQQGQADIDVLYIERTPRLAFDPSDTTYSSGLPAPGATVTFLAHVKNWGTATANVPYAWAFDGGPAGSGSVNVGPGATVTVPFNWTWQNSAHEVSFTADPLGVLPETTELNNQVSIRTNALRVGLWVEQSVYDFHHAHQFELLAGSNGFEDWGQRMMRRWNLMFQNVTLPFGAGGAIDRVALDKVVVVPDGALPLNGGIASNNPDINDRTVDMQWGYPYNANDFQPGGWWRVARNGAFYRDDGSIHEMNHARYQIDLYGLDAHQAPAGQPARIQIRDSSGNLITGTPKMPFISWEAVYFNKYGDIMGGPNSVRAYTAEVWNRKATKRGRGNMNAPPDIGVFLQDLPTTNRFRFIDQNAKPIASANVRVYQSTADNANWYGKIIDNTPDLTRTTDANGWIDLPRNPFGGSGISHTWGNSNADLVFGLTIRGQEIFFFQEVTDLNMAYWAGRTSTSETTRQIDVPDVASTVPTGSFLGNYFNASGQTYVTSRQDASIDFDWAGSPAPGVNADNFATTWLGDIDLGNGPKRFSLRTNGGVRLFVNDVLLIDQPSNTTDQTFEAIDTTTNGVNHVVPGKGAAQGARRVRLEFVHGTGAAKVHLNWEDVEAPNEVPVGAFRADQFGTHLLTDYWNSDFDDKIDFVYGSNGLGSPDPILWDGGAWSTRWTGDFDFAGGVYEFTARFSGGARAYADGELIFDQFNANGENLVYRVQKALTGRVRLVVEYSKTTGSPHMQFSWVQTSPGLQSLALDTTTIIGGAQTQGTVVLQSNAPRGGQVVALSSTNSAASVPENVTVPAGQKTARFTITTTRRTSATTATIRATLGDQSQSQNLEIRPYRVGSNIMMEQTSTHKLGFYTTANGRITGWKNVGPLPAGWTLLGFGDLTGDGLGDVVLQQNSTRKIGFWKLNGERIVSWTTVGPVAASWEVKGFTDFDGDGTDDILLYQTSSRTLGAWLVRSGAISGWASISKVAPGWDVAGGADLDSDTFGDVLLMNSTTRQLGAWLCRKKIVGWKSLGAVASGWDYRGFGDFDTTVDPDLLLVDGTQRRMGAWLTRTTSIVGWQTVGAYGPGWEVVGVAKL